MRLINADELKKKLQARRNNSEEDLDKGYDLGIGTAINLIDSAPTEPQVTVFAENASKEEIKDFKQELENVLEERPQGEWKKYKPFEPDYNVQCAVENLRKAYWSNEPEEVAKYFTEAEDTITSAICHYGYTVCKQPQGEWITDKNGDYICNQCRNYPLRNDNEKLTLSNYCPNCGAYMKGGADK